MKKYQQKNWYIWQLVLHTILEISAHVQRAETISSGHFSAWWSLKQQLFLATWVPFPGVGRGHQTGGEVRPLCSWKQESCRIRNWASKRHSDSVTQELGNSAEITASGFGCCSFYRWRFGFCALILCINTIAKQMCCLCTWFLTSTAGSGNLVITFVTVDAGCRQLLHPIWGLISE